MNDSVKTANKSRGDQKTAKKVRDRGSANSNVAKEQVSGERPNGQDGD